MNRARAYGGSCISAGRVTGLTVGTSPGRARVVELSGAARTREWCHTTSDEGSEKLINNRQNGRRRGRGGVRPPNSASNLERGSRLDNRARGNASQLHEKYKTLARDAQMQSDRVMAEYYLQFADHYFRVLSESRSRLDEQQQRRERADAQDFGDDDSEAETAEDRGDERARGSAGDARGENRPAARYSEGERDGRRDQNSPRQDREPRQTREPARENNRAAEQSPRAEAPREELPLGDAPEPRRPRGRRPRAQAEAEVTSAEGSVKEERIEIDRLPPALAAAPAASRADDTNADGITAAASDEPEEKPRRRTRRVAPPAPDQATVDA